MSNTNTTVTLNVGGVLHTTTTFTLRKYPDSMLGAMMSGKLPTTVDPQGNIFLDRDGNVFRHILNFLRTSALCIPTDFIEMDLLHAEADYYQIEPLVNLLNQHKEHQATKGTCYFLEIIEVRTGSTATMPTNNSRVKTILSGRKDAILSLPPALIGIDVLEKLQYKDPTEHAELELYGSNIRLKVGEALEGRGWHQTASDFSTSSGFDTKSLHNCLIIEHSYRDRWSMTLVDEETFTVDPEHLSVQTEIFTNYDSANDSYEVWG
ncbi:BTB/POZ domain-containing protein kctd15-like [Littorina saxatilis]|uniref:BTB domain-containing protein n=1 Tax=Littorina saxatilis TaxID=31220 RepID=A0AAN9B532_9CAEN